MSDYLIRLRRAGERGDGELLGPSGVTLATLSHQSMFAAMELLGEQAGVDPCWFAVEIRGRDIGLLRARHEQIG